MSDRSNVLDAIDAALSGIPGVGKVTQKLDSWSQVQPRHFPAVYYMDRDTSHEPLSFLSDDGREDMQGVFSLEIRTRTHSLSDGQTTALNAIMKQVEQTLMTSVGIKAVTKEVWPDGGSEVIRNPENMLFGMQTFSVRYYYNHAHP